MPSAGPRSLLGRAVPLGLSSRASFARSLADRRVTSATDTALHPILALWDRIPPCFCTGGKIFPVPPHPASPQGPRSRAQAGKGQFLNHPRLAAPAAADLASRSLAPSCSSLARLPSWAGTSRTFSWTLAPGPPGWSFCISCSKILGWAEITILEAIQGALTTGRTMPGP